MQRQLIIHIGTHKTGTTSIQNALRAFSAKLAESGIFVPSSGTLDERAGHHNIAWEIYGDARFDPKFGCLANLLEELRTSETPAAIISSEDFEYVARHPDRLKAFDASFAVIGYETRYMVFFRDRQNYLESLISELRKHDVGVSEDELRNDAESNGCILVKKDWYHDFFYRRFIRNWQDIVGPKLQSFDFERIVKGPGLLPFFFRIIGASQEIVRASSHLPRLNLRETSSATDDQSMRR